MLKNARIPLRDYVRVKISLVKFKKLWTIGAVSSFRKTKAVFKVDVEFFN